MDALEGRRMTTKHPDRRAVFVPVRMSTALHETVLAKAAEHGFPTVSAYIRWKLGDRTPVGRAKQRSLKNAPPDDTPIRTAQEAWRRLMGGV